MTTLALLTATAVFTLSPDPAPDKTPHRPLWIDSSISIPDHKPRGKNVPRGTFHKRPGHRAVSIVAPPCIPEPSTAALVLLGVTCVSRRSRP